MGRVTRLRTAARGRVLHEVHRGRVDEVGRAETAAGRTAARVPAVAARPERDAGGQRQSPGRGAAGRGCHPAPAGRPGVAGPDRASTGPEGGDGMTPVVEARNLAKSYETGGATVEALRGVDLTVERGEFVAIMGPSGCGKSTLLNLLAGFDRPTSGAVWIDGERVDGMTEADLARLRR